MEWQFEKSYRVKRERDFNDIFTKGNNVANRRFVVYRLPKEQKHFRVGLSVSKNWETLSCEIRLSAGFVTS